VPFNYEWIHDYYIRSRTDETTVIPTQLDVPQQLRVFDFVGDNATAFSHIAQQAKAIVSSDTTGAILFRSLNKAIHDASDFGHLWSDMGFDSVMHISCYNRKRAAASQGTDFVDTDVPDMVLGPHNEHACNPVPTGRIAFYGLQPAEEGGESLLRRNADIEIPTCVRDFIHQHGGILTTRSFPNHTQLLLDNTRHPTSMSWQERCGTTSPEECLDFFAQRGMYNATFDDEETLVVTSVHPGWLDGHWFNHLEYGFPATMADGTPFPLDWQLRLLKPRKWQTTSAFKLKRGDWLVLDNRRWQHGRLPYKGTRKLIVSYTD
jgi:hypothetical protein